MSKELSSERPITDVIFHVICILEFSDVLENVPPFLSYQGAPSAGTKAPFNHAFLPD